MTPTNDKVDQSGADEREKFERYMTNDCFRDLQELSTNEHGEYDDAEIDNAWSAWKAALQAQTAQAVSTLPERDPSKPAEVQGLFRKFDVRRADDSDAPGGKHHGCEYFVLDVDHDQHAPAAHRAYAEACKDTHPQLSADLQNRHGGPHTNVVNALIRERDGYQESTRLLQERLRLAQLDLDLRRAHQEKDVWFFQGDGEDHIESMGNGMVVVIHASDLRALLASKRSEHADLAVGPAISEETLLVTASVIAGCLLGQPNMDDVDTVYFKLQGMLAAAPTAQPQAYGVAK
ncbi:Hypothetical protein mma_2229 [Janthinobacterium sp. Marseille]|nr:hypothetical protein [Janthinobacterium sp. Marseille]ABR91895.1 Hypothetical protein mma_2229 [Janthinobacterium sp. Marseille]